MNVPFVNHHVHSYFSVLDGMPSPEEIAKAVKDMGQTHFSLTDHGTMSGIAEAYRAAKKHDLTFSPGIEFYYTQNRNSRHPDRYGSRDYHLILLATSNKGYKNLLKMNTPAWTEGFYRHPRVDYDILSQNSEDIVATTACLGGIVNQFLMRNDMDGALEELGKMTDVFGKENTFIEIQRSGEKDKEIILPKQLELSKRSGVPLLATADSHYAHKCDHDYHDTLICTSIGDQKLSSERKSLTFKGGYHLHSGEEMSELFPEDEFPGAVKNTVELAERMEFSMKIDDDLEYVMPEVKVESGKTEAQTLREHVYAGASQPSRYGDEEGNIPEHVKERIDYELGVVENMGFPGYFLIVENIVKKFAENGIFVGPGRGCLTGDAKVVTGDGIKEISKVMPGDMVITKDGEWGEVAVRHQYETSPNEKMIKVNTDRGESLTLTEKHKVLISDESFYSIDKEENLFVKASNLDIGDLIVSVEEGKNIKYSMVTSIDYVNAPHMVYDLSIMDGHPSFLTTFGTVHNSAPGSVAVYSLGITNVDPFSHDLYFERFLNPDRISMPDIDIDVPQTRRKEALRLMEDEYGKGHVAHLSNYGRFGLKESVRRVAKVYGNPPSVAQKASNEISAECESQGIKLADLAANPTPKTLQDNLRGMEHLDDVIEHASKIEGRMFSNGIHACGIVITTGPTDDYFPIRTAKEAILPVCQFDGDDASALGGVKMDILGLINLDECEEAERNIRLDLGEEVVSNNVPLDDPEVYEVLSQGDGGGIFQLGCLDGDTVIDGSKDMTIEKLWLTRNAQHSTKEIRSVYIGEGTVDYNEILEVMHSGKKMLHTMKAVLPDGNELSINATPEHKFMTHTGWAELGTLNTGDKIVAINQSDVGKNFVPQAVRGSEDAMEMFEKMYPEYIRIKPKDKASIQVGNASFYPTHYREDEYDDGMSHIAMIISERNIDYAQYCKQQCAENLSIDGRELLVKTFSEVVEEYQRSNKSTGKILLPLGTELAEIVSIEEYGIKDTFDISMHPSAQSYIANEFVVHNSSGIRSLLRNMRPDRFSDIPAALALYRPGPMGMDTHNEFCKRKNDPNVNQEVLHEDMADILSKTHNLAVFQEDIMALARHFAGYTGAEADELRKAVGKKIPAKMEEQRKKFVPAVNERYPDNLGQKLWDIIAPFGQYAFCKAHSTAYGFVSLRTAWLKAHYRPQFSGAVIDHDIDKGAKEIVDTMSWVRDGGVIVKNPDINTSDERTVTSKDSIILPLRMVSGVGDNVARDIINERKNNGDFSSVVDFMSRCKVSKGTLEKLAKAGAFDSLGASRAAIVDKSEDILSVSKTQKSSLEIQGGLFADLIEVQDSSDLIDVNSSPSEMYDEGKRLIIDQDLYGKWERESMSIILGPHPYSTIRNMGTAAHILSEYPPIDKFHNNSDEATFSGVLTDVTNKIAKTSGKEFSVFNIETDIAIVPGVAFSKLPVDICEGATMVMQGKIENDGFGDKEEGSFNPKAVVFSMKPINIDSLKEDDSRKE